MEQFVLSDVWKSVLEECDPAARALIARLAEAGWTVPEVGFELQDAQGRIVATAELAWPDHRIALLREDELGFQSAFTSHAWRAIALATAIADENSHSTLEPA